ncbi:MAG: DNA-directed RNA polymerase subunit alpha [Planctomycetota bacterium]
MRVRWRDFELPNRVVCDEKSITATYGRFVAEPFERGFGATIGNGLRRILLSSIEGAAVISVRIKGVDHEFSTIEGVREDVTDIILNIKKLQVRLNSDEPRKLTLSVKKQGTVTAADITPDPTVEIMNPDLLLTTLVDEQEFEAELIVKKGRGYITAEEHTQTEPEVGLIPVDAIFSPIIKVNYHVENTRVGKLTNYDKLIMEIWTNGIVTPEMALVEASKIYRRHINPFVQYFELGRELQIDEKKEQEERKQEEDLVELKKKLALSVSELDLSVRASNCLQTENISTIGELVTRTEPDLLKVKNFGKTSFKEVKKKLADMELSLGMDINTRLTRKD